MAPARDTNVDVESVASTEISTKLPPSAQYPLWKLVLSAIPWIGIQALWSTEFAVTTPYMKDLGMSDAMSSIIWVFGPIAGFFTAPIIGSFSDRCQSRIGRRRPYIMAGLVLLWIASLVFASSKYILPHPYSKWLAFAMFLVLDVVVNVIQTPIRAIVSDMASQDQQLHGQIISVVFQGVGAFLGFGIMKIWDVPYEAIFQVILVILSVVTAFVLIQVCICKEEVYVPPPDAPRQSILAPFVAAFHAIFQMPVDLAKIAFVQCFTWYAMFCYMPTVSTWFSVNVYGGSADAPEGSPMKVAYDEGQNANSIAGLLQSGLQILFSLILIAVLLKSSVPIRHIYAVCLYIGTVALVLAKFAVGHSVNTAILMITILAIPVSATNAFPFALVGAMNKDAQEAGRTVDTGMQMGVLNVFICTPQFIATLVVGALRNRLSQEQALPWVFFMGGVSFAIAGTGAWFVNDRLVSQSIKEQN